MTLRYILVKFLNLMGRYGLLLNFKQRNQSQVTFKSVDNQDSFELHLAALTARDNRVKTTESSGDEGSPGLLKPGRQSKEISDLETQGNGLTGRRQNMEIKGHLEIESPFSLR